ncbi:hypothetical protein L3Y34_016059 [Caenorhabditis briggsae]|uniref:Uncharacterized protein n=1 Tax=Caenorhabditis briggsae TaxID=6238 RepID=A0AAE9IZT4_CAEBR|nr:hypothetical protein L3Y34_016059 [Caenorhabditis briggsae]
MFEEEEEEDTTTYVTDGVPLEGVENLAEADESNNNLRLHISLSSEQIKDVTGNSNAGPRSYCCAICMKVCSRNTNHLHEELSVEENQYATREFRRPLRTPSKVHELFNPKITLSRRLELVRSACQSEMNRQEVASRLLTEQSAENVKAGKEVSRNGMFSLEKRYCYDCSKISIVMKSWRRMMVLRMIYSSQQDC